MSEDPAARTREPSSVADEGSPDDPAAARAAPSPAAPSPAAPSAADGRAPDREGSRQRRIAGPAVHNPARREEARPAVHSPRPELQILESRVYRGPNYWSYDKAIHLLVDLGSLEAFPSNTIPSFTDDLLALLPGLHDHTCGVGRRGGFVERLREGTWLGHVAEHVALQLQREAGGEQRRGKTRGAGRRGQYNVIYGYGDEQVGLAAGRLAVRLVNHLVEREPGFDFEAELERFILRAERTAFGPSTQAILDEAAARDIPWLRLNEYSLVQLGQGIYQQRIRATMTSRTSSLAVDVAGDKELTTRLLAAAGLPVPRSFPVHDVADALAAARRLGFPLVVKPLDGNHGRGVHLDLRSQEEVAAAFPAAQAEARRGTVLVETYVAGNDYRVLVVGGRMVAIAERVPAHVVGDGVHSVAELVELTNADPRRGVGHEKVLTRIRVDDAAVELVRDQGFELADVPPEGTMVKLTLTGNMSTGGISIDRTDEAHPDNVEIAEEAARVVGLDV
ncbi:MAG: cyanophycin synthetase family protein, partial [Actinomycetes bacterium]